MKACVIGYPISHSLSPVIHNYWLKKYNIEGEYKAVEVKPENLEEFILNLDKNGYRGCNITIPHKEKAFEIISKIKNISADDSLPAQVAKFMGAVNTIVVDENKNLVATNTDFLGFARNLIENAPEFDYNNSVALVLGAGGAGKAIAFALASMNVAGIVIANRTKEKSKEIKNILINKFGYSEDKIEVVDWDLRNDVLEHCNIVVNTTSIGMGLKDGRLEGKKASNENETLQSFNPSSLLTLSKLPYHSLVTDIVYNPLETDLLKQAKDLGHITVDGLGMLLHQAAPGFEGWFGKKPVVDRMLREEVLKSLNN